MPPTPKSRFRKLNDTDGHRKSPHPDEPFAGLVLAPVLTIATLCIIFILYRRASSIKYVVQHQLRTWTGRGEGQIRLSEDDGPAATSFVADEDQDNEDEVDDRRAVPVKRTAVGGI